LRAKQGTAQEQKNEENSEERSIHKVESRYQPQKGEIAIVSLHRRKIDFPERMARPRRTMKFFTIPAPALPILKETPLAARSAEGQWPLTPFRHEPTQEGGKIFAPHWTPLPISSKNFRAYSDP
jgi:hypothetical protein